ATGALVWGVVTTGVAYYAGTLIPLEVLVSGVVKVSSIILSGVVLWFGVPPAYRFLKEKFIAWRNSHKPENAIPSHPHLQAVQESPVLLPITEDKIKIKQAIEND
ncbi:MAG: DedA family protein, partial [Pseudanabaena sp.]